MRCASKAQLHFQLRILNKNLIHAVVHAIISIHLYHDKVTMDKGGLTLDKMLSPAFINVGGLLGLDSRTWGE